MNWTTMALWMLPYIIVGGAAVYLVYRVFKNKSARAQMLFLRIICGCGIVLLIINKAVHYFKFGEQILALLPLHLCYISLLFFMSMAMYTKSKICRDFIFYISSLGALMAIIFPSSDYLDGGFSLITFTYFAFHLIIVCVPIWMFLWKLYSPKTTVINAAIIFVILFTLAFAVHQLNLLLVKNGVANANYFWTLIANAEQNNNIALLFFAKIISKDFLYLIFAAPILFAYMGIWALAMRVHKKRKCNKLA